MSKFMHKALVLLVIGWAFDLISAVSGAIPGNLGHVLQTAFAVLTFIVIPIVLYFLFRAWRETVARPNQQRKLSVDGEVLEKVEEIS